MGKHLGHKHSDVHYEDYHHGCMWDFHHFFDYHHWQNVKKLLPHRQHGGGRHARGNDGARSSSKDHEIDEVLEFLGAECDCIVEQTTSKTISTNKRSGIARIKALIAKEMSKEEHHKQQAFHFPVGSRLQRTYSIHHLEPSNDCLAETKTDWKHPIILLHKIADHFVNKSPELPRPSAPENLVARNNNCFVCGTMNFADRLGINQNSEMHVLFSEQCEKASETSDNQNIMDAYQINKDVSDVQFQEYVDVLEVFKVNKELFLDVSRDPNVGKLDHVNSLQDSKTKSRLTKFGSFPMTGLSHSRKFRPSEFEHEQKEIRPCPKVENLLNGTRAPKLVVSKSSKDLYTKSVSFLPDTSVVGVLKLERSRSSPSSTNGLDDKKRGQIDEERRLKYINRASSLNSSLDRYAQLFEHSFNKDKKFHISKSMKLTNEDEFLTGGHGPKYFRRILSLSSLESPSALENEGCRDSPMSRMPIKPNSISSKSNGHDEPELVSLPMSTEKWLPVNDAVLETQCRENMIEESDSCPRNEYTSELTRGINDEGINALCELSENMAELIRGESNSHPEAYAGITGNASSHFAQESQNLKDNVACNAESQISEGSELKPMFMHSDDQNELNNCVNLKSMLNTDAMSASFSRVNSENNDSQKIEKAKAAFNNYFLHVELDGKNDTNFNYVKDVLKKSGIIGTDYLRTWHSLNQPLSPSLFEELEECLLNEAGLCGEEVVDSWDHQLLFDLVNVVLLETYDKSYTYWPRALSHSCRVHPTPMAHHFLEEVLKIISRYLSLGSEQDPSLDYAVAQDLAKDDDGWMNFQLDTECVALEIEDIVFDELLDEFLCS